jgi:desulfoferrodoxin (superoxide reductase-like protein)
MIHKEHQDMEASMTELVTRLDDKQKRLKLDREQHVEAIESKKRNDYVTIESSVGPDVIKFMRNLLRPGYVSMQSHSFCVSF